MDIDIGTRMSFSTETDSDGNTGMDEMSDSVMRTKDTYHTLAKTNDKTQTPMTLGKTQEKTQADENLDSAMTQAVLYFLEDTDPAAISQYTTIDVELCDATVRALPAALPRATSINEFWILQFKPVATDQRQWNN